MELRFSEVKRVPYIYVDEHHRIQFVNEPTMMKDDKFKWVTVIGQVLEVVKKGKKEYGGERQAHKSIYQEHSDIVDFSFNNLDSEIKNCKKLKKVIPALKKIIVPFLDKNGYFPVAALDSFNDKLQGLKDEMEAIKQKKIARAQAKAV